MENIFSPWDRSNGDALKLLELAKTSPALALKKDKKTWLTLFHKDGFVEDPVGAPAHRGKQEISSFFDTFIAENKVVFDVHDDWVDLQRAKVYRNIDIHTTFGFGGIHVQPVHLEYTFELSDSPSETKLKSLRAFWNFLDGYPSYEIDPIKELLSYPIGSTLTFYNIFKLKGVNFGLDYLTNVGKTAFSKNNYIAMEMLNSIGKNVDLKYFFQTNVEIQVPNGEKYTPLEFQEHMFKSGVFLEVEKVYKAGAEWVSSSFWVKSRMEREKKEFKGIGIFKFDKEKISELTLVW